MDTQRAGGYISKLQFNNGKSLDISKNSIVIFVGPNNAGKSQSLKDIYSLSDNKVPSVVISDIKISKYTSSVGKLLKQVSPETDEGYCKRYNILGSLITVNSNADEDFRRKERYSSFRRLFVANLDTSARLTICTPAKNITRNEAKQHPIHFAAYDGKYRKWLSQNFKKAFNEDLIPNTQYGATIPLCIGPLVKLNGDFDDEQTRQEKYAEILASYKQVQDQGDGIKSFTGILLYLMLDYYCTYLIDEPESFLHPPQARIMGQIIGETLKSDQQAFISTHSEEIIKGLLEVCPERIKIVRITRKDDTNSFSVLDNEQFTGVWNDPLMKYSNIMSSLFHKTVVLCESDSDCKMYSIIEDHLKKESGHFSETLFIHCGGKHRMAKIASALKMLNVDVKLIPDIDVLNDETVFKGIIEAFGLEWATIQADYNNIVSNLHCPNEKITRSSAQMQILQIFAASHNPDLSSREVKDCKEVFKTASKWDPIKKGGIAALPAGNATVSFNKINQILKPHGIFIVTVGELECFIKEIGGHGPEWVNQVLETYPDLNNDVYKQIKEFITGMDL